MGNRCIIKGENSNIGVYLHWNSGKKSVYSFLNYCKEKQYRDLSDGYGVARLCQVIGNYFGGTSSIGIEIVNDDNLEEVTKHLDNGIYIINNNWEEIKHIGNCYTEKYDENELLKSIDEAQPVKEQLGDYLFAEEVEAETLEVGDKIYYIDYNDELSIETVVGIKYGWNPYDIQPYMDKYHNQNNGKTLNPNNILKGKVRKVNK